MKTCFVLLVFFLVSPTMQTLGQEKSAPQISPAAQIGKELFDNTLLNQGEFRAMLRDVVPDSNDIEELIQKAVWMYQDQKSESSMLRNSVKVRELVSFELRDKVFYFRAMSVEQWRELERKPVEDLPSDLKSKQLFQVTAVTAESLTIKRGETQLSIPAERIIYFQRGSEAFLK